MATARIAPRSSTIAAAVRKMRSSTGTRDPSMTISATAKAVSVDIGTPQPCIQGPDGTMRRSSAAGATMPPIAPATGSAAERQPERWPTVNSRLISRPTTRKNRVKSPSLIQCCNDSEKPCSSNVRPNRCSQNAAKSGPRPVLVKTTATIVAASSRRPADGPQLAKSSAAERTRWPSVPSIASASALWSHGPS